jgi:hypothetical protein
MLETLDRIRDGTYTDQDECFVRSQFEADLQDDVVETLKDPLNDPHKILEHLE